MWFISTCKIFEKQFSCAYHHSKLWALVKKLVFPMIFNEWADVLHHLELLEPIQQHFSIWILCCYSTISTKITYIRRAIDFWLEGRVTTLNSISAKSAILQSRSWSSTTIWLYGGNNRWLLQNFQRSLKMLIYFWFITLFSFFFWKKTILCTLVFCKQRLTLLSRRPKVDDPTFVDEIDGVCAVEVRPLLKLHRISQWFSENTECLINYG